MVSSTCAMTIIGFWHWHHIPQGPTNMYFYPKLKNFNVISCFVTMFYSNFIRSALFFTLICWFATPCIENNKIMLALVLMVYRIYTEPESHMLSQLIAPVLSVLHTSCSQLDAGMHCHVFTVWEYFFVCLCFVPAGWKKNFASGSSLP